MSSIKLYPTGKCAKCGRPSGKHQGGSGNCPIKTKTRSSHVTFSRTQAYEEKYSPKEPQKPAFTIGPEDV